MKKTMIISLLAMSWLCFVACSPKDTAPDIIVDEEEKQAIQALVGKWKYEYEYSTLDFRDVRDIYKKNRPSLTISQEDIIFKNAKKEAEYPIAKYAFARSGKDNIQSKTAFYYTYYAGKIDFRVIGAFPLIIYPSQPDTLYITGSISNYYFVLSKEK